VTTILFAVKVDPATVNFVIRKMIEMGKIPFGDFRDWNVIAVWAKGTTVPAESVMAICRPNH
jgi:hypothetical protein